MKTNTKISANLDNRIEEFVVAYFDDVEGPMYVGARVTVCEKNSNSSGEATIAHIDNNGKRILLEVQWDTLTSRGPGITLVE